MFSWPTLASRARSAARRERNGSPRSGFQIGTPGYMSPEQVAAEATIDGRSDIYSMGCVLYEMLAGEKPFSGSSANALMARHIFDPVPPLTTVRRALPKSVEAVVFRALAKSPADRFGSAAEFAQVLEAVAKDPQVSVAQSPRKARRVALAMLAVAALAAVTLVRVAIVGARGRRAGGRGGGHDESGNLPIRSSMPRCRRVSRRSNFFVKRWSDGRGSMS